MRVKQPEPFDPNREYNPGKRNVAFAAKSKGKIAPE